MLSEQLRMMEGKKQLLLGCTSKLVVEEGWQAIVHVVHGVQRHSYAAHYLKHQAPREAKGPIKPQLHLQ
ncbi:hypothetical protein E2C01_003095 [Portunus trituberculatus]|uniref:Uncharacterized protein n=1 Tax=Portunus trituberculatus TaxID=210409 RepID=A0A5B7CLN3_PORTR|nr:hypothetical protein [Portunus trituberculatus]